MAEVGPEYQFLHAEVGMNGKNSDGGACEQRPLRKALENNTLNLPKPTLQSGDLDDIPFVCVGSDAFFLKNFQLLFILHEANFQQLLIVVKYFVNRSY